MAQEKSHGGDTARKVSNVMTANPKTVTDKDSILDAAKIMRDSDTGVVPVVDGKRIIGMITDRDICHRGAARRRYV